MERFPISTWTYFDAKDAWDNLAVDYRDLGMTNPMSPQLMVGQDPQPLLRQLDLFHAQGLKAIVRDFRLVASGCMGISEEAYREKFRVSLEEIGWHPAVSGFMVGDEPGASELPHYMMCARVQREMAPHLVPCLNLLPWQNNPGAFGTDTYGEYIDKVFAETKLPLIGFDCYSQMQGDENGLEMYFNCLREMRDGANRNNTAYGITLLSAGHFGYACPTQADFRWQISTSAALGAKSLCYYYTVEVRPWDNYSHFPINQFRERTEAFSWLADENRMFLFRHAELLTKLRCVSTAFTVKAYGGNDWFVPDNTLLAFHSYNGINMLVSTFVDDAGNKYRAIVNVDREKSSKARMVFAPNVRVEQLEIGRAHV